jgi:Carboxypeptidase regulatory-like domain
MIIMERVFMLERAFVLFACLILQSVGAVYAQQDSANNLQHSSATIFAPTSARVNTECAVSEVFGSLQGKIIDKASGEAVAEARITFTDLDGDLSELLSTPPSDNSRANGEVRLLNLKPSRYSLECTATGYKRFASEFLVLMVAGDAIRFRVEMMRE